MQSATHVKEWRDGGACECGGHYYWRNYCGAYICEKCDAHKGLGRCFCGWRKGQNRVWIDGKIVVEKGSGYAFERETPEGEDSDYFGDEPVEDGMYRE